MLHIIMSIHIAFNINCVESVCVCVCVSNPIQDLTPLELVKAARRAHGESIDV